MLLIRHWYWPDAPCDGRQVLSMEPRLKITFLTDNFPPERNTPAMRTWEHVSRWAKEGHEVIVITTAPNFPQGKPIAGYKNH